MSEVSIETLKDSDRWHPTTEFQFPDEHQSHDALESHSLSAILGWISEDGHGAPLLIYDRMCGAAKVLGLKLRTGETRREGVRASAREFEAMFMAGSLCQRQGQFLEALRRVLSWMFNDGRSTPLQAYRKFLCATFHLCREITGASEQTQLLTASGTAHKQSFNRDVIQFCDTFDFHNPLCRSEQARESFREREAKKSLQTATKRAAAAVEPTAKCPDCGRPQPSLKTCACDELVDQEQAA